MLASPAPSPRRDAIAIIESAYLLDLTDSEWLASVLDAASPEFDRGLGSYAFLCRVDRGKMEIGPTFVERNLDPRFAAVVAELNQTAPAEVFELFARSSVLSGGFAQTVPRAISRHVKKLGANTGVVDAFALFAQDGEGFGVNITGPSQRAIRSSPRVRGTWNRVGLHLASAARLRRRFAAARAVRDAVLEPGGRIAHAEGDVRRSRSARELLAAAVRDVERARTVRERQNPERALRLWQGLVAGEWSLVDQWETDGRRFVAAYQNRPEVRDPRALTKHERVILHYAALGGSNKEIAFTLGLSTGSVATGVSQLLRKLRCKRRSDLVALMDPSSASHASIALDGEELGVLSFPQALQDAVAHELTGAERDVAKLVVAGRTNAAIARHRGTSPQTVANQIRSMFDKLGVGSRAALVHRLTRGTE